MQAPGYYQPPPVYVQPVAQPVYQVNPAAANQYAYEEAKRREAEDECCLLATCALIFCCCCRIAAGS